MNIKEVFKQIKGSDKVPELTLHFKRPKLSKTVLDTTKSQVDFLRKLFDKGTFEMQEEMIVLIIDNQDLPICYYKMAKGTKDSVPVDLRILFQVLLVAGAERFILSHNHPSGPPLASWADMDMTHAVNLRAYMFGMQFVDHIVISSLKGKKKKPGYFSLADNGFILPIE